MNTDDIPTPRTDALRIESRAKLLDLCDELERELAEAKDILIKRLVDNDRLQQEIHVSEADRLDEIIRWLKQHPYTVIQNKSIKEDYVPRADLVAAEGRITELSGKIAMPCSKEVEV